MRLTRLTAAFVTIMVTMLAEGGRPGERECMWGQGKGAGEREGKGQRERQQEGGKTEGGTDRRERRRDCRYLVRS